MQAEIARRQEILEKAPVITKVIKSPRENSWRRCEDCQMGKREESQLEPEPLRTIYAVLWVLS